MANQGPRVPEEHLEHIFDKFYRLSPDGTFEFVEEARGETSVILYDASRDYYIQLDVQGMQVLLGQGGQQYQPLYRITRVVASGTPATAGAAPQAASASCNKVGKLRSRNSALVKR